MIVLSRQETMVLVLNQIPDLALPVNNIHCAGMYGGLGVMN